MCAWGVGAMRSMGGRQGMPCGEWRVGVYPSRDVGWILGGGGLISLLQNQMILNGEEPTRAYPNP